MALDFLANLIFLMLSAIFLMDTHLANVSQNHNGIPAAECKETA